MFFDETSFDGAEEVEGSLVWRCRRMSRTCWVVSTVASVSGSCMVCTWDEDAFARRCVRYLNSENHLMGLSGFSKNLLGNRRSLSAIR